MLIQITCTAESATDIGYLLHKNPANLHSVDLPFGKAIIFYPEAQETRCTAALLLEVDPVGLVRGARRLEQYVNDRPYVASSYMTVAIGKAFGTALTGTCKKRPELVERPLPLTIRVEVVRARGGDEIPRRLFQPLGYNVDVAPIPLDENFPEWRPSRYVRIELGATVTVHDALSHLYVLLPVLDDEKHYFIGDAEVEKLMRHGEGWLSRHPEKSLIVSRYLKRRVSLIQSAFAQLMDEEGAEIEAAEENSERSAKVEQDLERPLTLHTQRLNLVAARIRELGARNVLDLGCGEGKLLRRLLADRAFERIVGMDVSHRCLEIAAQKLRLDRMPERQRRRIEIFQGSLLYRDKRLAGFDAAALVEVIEHMDSPRLGALERAVFEFARPQHVLVTTPNREYNVLFPSLPEGRLRHGDHRFEWTRQEFASWADRIASRFGYLPRLEPVGPEHPTLGAPSQLAVFSLQSEGVA